MNSTKTTKWKRGSFQGGFLRATKSVFKPASMAQLDARQTDDQEVADRYHSFMEIRS